MNFSKTIQTALFSGKLVLRTRLIPLVFILLHSYIFYIFYLYRYDTFSPPSALNTSSQLVIAGMLTYLLFGIWMIRIEESSSMEELSTIIHKGYFTMFIGKCLVGVTFILLGQISIFVAYLLFFYGQPILEYSYLRSVFIYIGLFWSGSFFISYLIGMLLASLIRGKFIYPLSLVVYCMLIPINYVFLESLNRFFHVPLDKWFNLGEPNPHSNYHALYGFSLEPAHFWKKLLLITLIFLIFLMLFIKKKIVFVNKKLILTAAICVIIVIASTFGLMKEKQLLVDDTIRIIDYYRKYDTDIRIEMQNIKLENVNILLEPKEQLHLEVDIEVLNTGDNNLSKLFFTLFHELKVNHIEIDGKIVEFLQDGDRVEIRLNKELGIGQKVKVTFDYEGLQTDLYFGNQQSIYLPNHLAWIPSINYAPAFDIVTKQNGLHRISHKYMQETNYQLTVNYNKKIYTNLDKKEKNKWSGNSSSGITVISGMLNEKKYQDVTIIYPITWEDSIHGFGKFETYVNNVYTHLKKGLSIIDANKPKQIYFLPTTNISDSLVGESAFIDHESIIIGTPIYLDIDRDFFNLFLDELTYEIVPAFTTRDLPYDKQQYEFNTLFNLIYARLLNKQMRLNDDTDHVNNFIEHKLTINEKVNSVLGKLNTWLKKDEANNSHHPLYKEWYKLVREGQGWAELNTLLNKYNNM
ncbi:hypothetical protein JOC75_000683 [Metabacillus crassostreae]|uniref:hypothetical protein n=1 Tax=Metabacillus crassostreae TaxID=929098 RepID=UPI00195E4B39|nr:hypothetical protein [Metabacillus crassostreae]MBM7602713.1 hypothetical protein [Metabacillus crassostreae]